MVLKKLLPHQGQFLQAPYVFPELRFFFLIGGYACGKTSALQDAILNAVDYYHGKKDGEGKNPKIMVGGISLTFLRKTLTGGLEQILKNTKSEYLYDKAHNIMYVAGVELLLIPIQNEEDIFGYDCCFEGNTPVATKNGQVAIKDITIGDYVYTRKGLRRVTHVWDKGERECIPVTVNGKTSWCTPDHKYIDVFNNEIEAQDLTKNTTLVCRGKRDIVTTGNIDKDINVSNIQKHNVYDIEVEGEHNFFANNVLVHNCCAFIDELDELPTYNAMAVVKACNDRCRQIVEGCREPFLSFATTSQGLKGTYQTCMSFKNTGMPFMIIRGRTKDNTYLPKEYVASMYKIYNEKEIECLLEGKFIAIDSGLVFPDYNPAKNKLDVDLYDTVTDDDVVFIGQDFNGFGNYAMAMIIRFDSIVIIKEYKLPDMRRAPEVFRHDFPTADIVWIPDMTYKDHFSEFKKELHAYNIRIAYRKCNPLVNDRNFACNKLFHAEKLFVCPICTMTDTGLMTHQKDKKTGAPMKGGNNAPDHLNDCLGYAVHYMLSWCRPLKPLYNVTLRYMYTKRADQGASKEMLESGYRLLDGDQLKGLGAPKKKKKKRFD